MSLTKVTSNVINDVDASKLTGSIADARVPASAVTQHSDTSTLRSDILKLALHQAVDGNRVAYNLENSFIDGFEDDTGITTETNVDRNSDEYVSSVTFGSPAYDATDRSSSWTISSNLSAGSGLHATSGAVDGVYVNGNTASESNKWFFNSGTGITGKYVRFQLPSAKIFTKVSHYFDAGGNAGNWKWQGSNDGSNWTDIGSTYQWNTGSNSAGWYEYTTMSSNTTAYTYYQVIGDSGSGDGGFNNPEIKFEQADLTVSATGTLISDAQTASSSRTSCSGVIIYSDASGTATLGTDLKIYFTCNNGTNWTEASSYGTATTYSGTKKLVKLGATTCTAGTQVAMKAVWANQASGSKETRLEGWAVNY